MNFTRVAMFSHEAEAECENRTIVKDSFLTSTLILDHISELSLFLFFFSGRGPDPLNPPHKYATGDSRALSRL